MWQEILKISRDLGIHDLGLAYPEDLKGQEALLAWRRQAGWELEIEEEDLARRIDPRRTLASCRSILLVFIQLPPSSPLALKEGEGRLASVSWGRDYHQVLKEKIQDLAQAIKKRLGPFEGAIQVDTGPLLERSLAQATGRGIIGKNGLFIHRDLGSYVALGLLLTDLDLREDRQEALFLSCKDCQACQKACPGQALGEEGINPQTCRSWISQKKGDLGPEEEKILGDSLYGCDVCQWVCPLNQGIKTQDLSLWGPLRKTIQLGDLQTLSNRDFKRAYGQLAGAWRGKKVWLRNREIIYKNHSDSN
ncbi:MAG: tRNA epoxyqueuosine(34) reductase QueG [Tissierellia bacterium]|nr:tRNA epoxyqueuosine(34) reductase QueG [Tissierellia bacterium]